MSPGAARSLGPSLAGERVRPAVVLLHGFMGRGTDWQDVTRKLDDRYLCVAPDLPGHGASLGLTDEAYGIGGAAKTVLEVLDGLETPRATLVGYSMGGRLALYLALRHPERCSGLFLESASPGIENPEDRRTRREADAGLARRLESEDFEGFLREWYGQPLFASLARDEALLERTIAARLQNEPAELARSLRGMGAGSMPPLWEELAGLRVPALAIAGELDEKFAEISHRMARRSPRMRTALIPDAGHNVHAEAPGAYLVALEGFLRDP